MASHPAVSTGERLSPPTHKTPSSDPLPYKVWTPFCGLYLTIAAFSFEEDAARYRDFIVGTGTECWLQTPLDVYHASARSDSTRIAS